jgi:hypothetical protein
VALRCALAGVHCMCGIPFRVVPKPLRGGIHGARHRGPGIVLCVRAHVVGGKGVEKKSICFVADLHVNSSRRPKADAAMVPVVTVPTRAAKPVKDALKQAGWLHASLKPQVGSASVSFPLADGAGPAVEAALGADATLRGSGAAVGFLARDGLAAKKQVPPQGRAAAAPRAGAGGYAPARQAPAPCPVAAPPQERSFGSGSQQRLQTSALPPALPVRRVACAAGTSHSWLAQHVYSGRAPAILTGADLGPCVQNWSAARLAKARCAVPRVSVHVCASAAVDLAGHRWAALYSPSHGFTIVSSLPQAVEARGYGWTPAGSLFLHWVSPDVPECAIGFRGHCDSERASPLAFTPSTTVVVLFSQYAHGPFPPIPHPIPDTILTYPFTTPVFPPQTAQHAPEFCFPVDAVCRGRRALRNAHATNAGDCSGRGGEGCRLARDRGGRGCGIRGREGRRGYGSLAGSGGARGGDDARGTGGGSGYGVVKGSYCTWISGNRVGRCDGGGGAGGGVGASARLPPAARTRRAVLFAFGGSRSQEASGRLSVAISRAGCRVLAGTAGGGARGTHTAGGGAGGTASAS